MSWLRYCKRLASVALLLFLFLGVNALQANNVIIVVIDGARYSETFGAGATYIPRMWNQLRPRATIYTNFYNLGETSTNPGHATILSGTWQFIANDGSERPTMPTLFEYRRSQTVSPMTDNFVVAGKTKLHVMTYSSHPAYGGNYRADSLTNPSNGDLITYSNLISVLSTYHPGLVLVNFADVDLAGHSGVWDNYVAAIQRADSLVYELWQWLQSDGYYQNNTTLFVTNDHGRHDDAHGGFKHHGDNCNGCQHIMLLAIGKGVTPGQVVTEMRDQRDIAPTVGDILGFETPLVDGTSLYIGDTPLPVQLQSFTAQPDAGMVKIFWETASEVGNLGFVVWRASERDGEYRQIASYLPNPDLRGHSNSNQPHRYHVTDYLVIPGNIYWYKLASVDVSGKEHIFGPISAHVKTGEENFVRYDEVKEQNFQLFQNFPNPFNHRTLIRFNVPRASHVQFTIYNLDGQLINQLFSGYLSEGSYRLYWAGTDAFNRPVSSGTYLGVLKTPYLSKSIRIVLLK